MQTIKVSVRKQNVAIGIPGDSKLCMIQDALKEAVPTATRIHVDTQSVRFSDLKTGKRFRYFTPVIGQKAILDFDKGIVVQPFKMTLKDGTVENIQHRHTTAKAPTPAKKKAASAKRAKTTRVVAGRERQFGLRMFTEETR